MLLRCRSPADDGRGRALGWRESGSAGGDAYSVDGPRRATTCCGPASPSRSDPSLTTTSSTMNRTCSTRSSAPPGAFGLLGLLGSHDRETGSRYARSSAGVSQRTSQSPTPASRSGSAIGASRSARRATASASKRSAACQRHARLLQCPYRRHQRRPAGFPLPSDRSCWPTPHMAPRTLCSTSATHVSRFGRGRSSLPTAIRSTMS